MLEAGHEEDRVDLGRSLRFRWAIWSSLSKSLTARSPRTMKPAPDRARELDVSPSKVVTSTRSPAGAELLAERLADDVGTRSSRRSSGDLRVLTSTADDEPVEDRARRAR